MCECEATFEQYVNALYIERPDGTYIAKAGTYDEDGHPTDSHWAFILRRWGKAHREHARSALEGRHNNAIRP